MRRLVLGCVLLAACEPAVRPTPPDVGVDAPLDAPSLPDAGACTAIDGYYLGSTTCPGLDAPFGACVTQTECGAQILLGSSGAPVNVNLLGARGTFEDPMLATDVTCTDLVVETSRLRLTCTDRLGIGCEVMLQARASDRSGLCCVQDSACQAGEACTLVALGAGPPITTACVTRTGSSAAGEACTRVASGEDDCAAGLYCSGIGEIGDALSCHPLCRSAADCSGEVCVAADTAPAMGFCSEACDVFELAACGEGRGCTPVPAYRDVGNATLAGTCAEAGPSALGDSCEFDGCQAGLLCARDPLLALRCAPPCDDSHACDTGSCIPLADGESLGACF